ncbi:MAG: DUF1294 domain-containing protein [Alistipes sp.]|nr:DUF1294 domain-containing protein [Alistipes sp.]
MEINNLLIYLCVLASVSIAAFVMYGIDKRKAIRKQWRTKEAALLGVGFFFGSAGALLGMKVFRHKTKHTYFWVINIVGLIWQLGVLGWMIYSVLAG